MLPMDRSRLPSMSLVFILFHDVQKVFSTDIKTPKYLDVSFTFSDKMSSNLQDAKDSTPMAFFYLFIMSTAYESITSLLVAHNVTTNEDKIHFLNQIKMSTPAMKQDPRYISGT
jgi:hypothetical protein